MHVSKSTGVFFGLVALLAVFGAAGVYLPQGEAVPTQEFPAPRWVLALGSFVLLGVVYGLLGWLGLRLSRNVGLPDVWDDAIDNRRRLVIPGVVGACVGVALILVDTAMAPLHALGPLPHPPFPTSLVASVVAGIGEELVFRLLFVSFWVWLVSKVILRGRYWTPVFWAATAVSAVAFAFAHVPSLFILLDVQSIGELPTAMLAEILILNSLVSFAAAYFFKQAGFLGAVSVHFWTDVVWHVVWGLV